MNVKAIMTKSPACCTPDTTLTEVAEMLLGKRTRCIACSTSAST